MVSPAQRSKNYRWIALITFLLAQAAVIYGVYWINANPQSVPLCLKPLLDGFGGNVFSGLIGSFLFLILAFYLNAQTEEQIANIHTATTKSENILAEREQILEDERTKAAFEQFIKKESYHNIRFPDLKPSSDSLGLEYTVMPARDPKTGTPVIHETEMEIMYVVKVQGPAHVQVMTAEHKKEYENSPIRDDEFAFCRFFNSSWHLGHSTPNTPYKFYLSGKVGPVEYGQDANRLMSTYADPFQGMTKIATFYLLPDGLPVPPEGAGCDGYEIYKDTADNLFLRINGSQPKQMYYTNPPETYDGTGWFFVIENIRGYAFGEKLLRIHERILRELKTQNVQPKQIPWFNTDEHRYEPPP